MGSKEESEWEGMDISIMEQMKRRSRDSRDKAHTNIAKIMSTVPGVMEERLIDGFLWQLH